MRVVYCFPIILKDLKQMSKYAQLNAPGTLSHQKPLTWGVLMFFSKPTFNYITLQFNRTSKANGSNIVQEGILDSSNILDLSFSSLFPFLTKNYRRVFFKSNMTLLPCVYLANIQPVSYSVLICIISVGLLYFCQSMEIWGKQRYCILNGSTLEEMKWGKAVNTTE